MAAAAGLKLVSSCNNRGNICARAARTLCTALKYVWLDTSPAEIMILKMKINDFTHTPNAICENETRARASRPENDAEPRCKLNFALYKQAHPD